MKKRLIIFGTISIAAILTAFLFVQKKPFVGIGGSPAPTLAPPAPTGSAYEVPQGATYSFKTEPIIPTSMLVYSYAYPSFDELETVAKNAAGALSLASESGIIRNTLTIETWSRPSQAKLSLTQTGEATSFTFSQALPPPTSPTQPSAAVQQFLLLLTRPASGIALSSPTTNAGPFDGLLILDKVRPTSFTQYAFSYTVGGYPITTYDYARTAASVIVDNLGVIRAATIFPPPSQISPKTSYATLSKEQILASLAAGRGRIITTRGITQDQGEVPAFRSFAIESTTPVYVPVQGLLLPGYILDGTGTGATGKLQRVSFFIWAFPEIKEQ